MSIKVLHVYKTFFPETVGGGEQVIFQLCKNSNIESRVLCLTKKSKKTVENYEGIKVIRYPQTLSYASCPISVQALLNFKKESDWADIIHYHYPWPFGDVLSLFAAKRKSLVTYLSDIVKQKTLRYLYYPLEQWFLYKIDKIVPIYPNSTVTSTNLIKYKSKVEVIPVGIEKNNYPKPNLNNCKKLKEKFGNKFFLFIGQLRYYKGLHILLEAISGTHHQLVIAGMGTEYNNLKKQAQEKKLDNVYFLGQINDSQKVDLLNSCLCLVLPSHLRSEAFGIVLVEGAMYGKPLISCAIGTGTDYINQHKKTGFVVPPNDPASLKKAMSELAENPKLAEKMGKAALERYKELFTAKDMREKFTNLYKTLLE
jgi:glycosyltransferase involved in cell wall biosynthesis